MQPDTPRLALTSAERRASISLAGLFAARMLGLFLLLPVFAVAAKSLDGGLDPAKVGLALGIYGLTQAVMQIPFGMASDRFGRRPIVLIGLSLFVVGSVICAVSDDIFWVTIGRAIQGSGAISAAITAWLADATRPEVRTRAMAMIGASIGLSFALSLVIAPIIVGWGGLSGLFWLITGLGAVAFVVAALVVPAVPRTPKPEHPLPAKVVLAHPGLLRLNFGVFCLHLSQVALFVVMPPLLVSLGGIQTDALWQVYLPVLFVSFVFMVPIIIFTEKRRAHPKTLRFAVAGLVAVGIGFAVTGTNWLWLLFWLTAFFIAFNVLEALQPSLVSRVAPPEMKGLALGVYNTTQATGLFLGGALGGWLVQSMGNAAVFWVIAGLSAIWLAVTWRLTMPEVLTSRAPANEQASAQTAA